MLQKYPTNVLKERFNKDLHWLFDSAPLMDKSLLDFSRPSFLQPQFDSKEVKTELYDFIVGKNLKMLGPYFEGLWQFYLENSNDTELIDQNLQVINDKQTLGEFDFIYFDRTNKSHIHLEVSIKYYLGVPGLNNALGEVSEMSAWIGPNKNDRLDKKFYKLKDHQSKLSEAEVAKEILLARGVSEVQSQVCLLGYLFYPYEQAMSPPENSFSAHNRGTWISLTEFSKSRLNKYFWKIIEKPFWLSQPYEDRNSVLTLEEVTGKISAVFSIKNYPILIARYSLKNTRTETNDVNYLKFEELVFVVPDDWK